MGLAAAAKRAISYLKGTSGTRTLSVQSFVCGAHSTSLSPLRSCNYCMVNSFPEPIISCAESVLFCLCSDGGARLFFGQYIDIRDFAGNAGEVAFVREWMSMRNSGEDVVVTYRTLSCSMLFTHDVIAFKHIFSRLSTVRCSVISFGL